MRSLDQTASDNFYGRGQLTVTNTSTQELTLFMPVGTLFPSVNPAQQTMAGYATNIQVSNPQQAPQQLPAAGDGTSGAALLLFAFAWCGFRQKPLEHCLDLLKELAAAQKDVCPRGKIGIAKGWLA